MHYDITVIGSGIAGLYACISAEREYNVLLISKSDFLNSNTYLAQGGIAGVLGADDSFESHFEDTLRAGKSENDKRAVEVMVKEGPHDILKLKDMGVEFDSGSDGKLLRTLEGGHSIRRIVHCKDSTGMEVAKKLLDKAMSMQNISLMEDTFVYDIEKRDGEFIVYMIDPKGQKHAVISSNVVLATGGVGKIYKYTTNSSIATGDGICLARKLGAKTKNMRYIQFHPTALDVETDERPLISEAVRGEGAYLLNERGQRFMHKYSPMKELAPRDDVCSGIMEELKHQDTRSLYLDISHKSSAYIKNRFPYIYEKCMEWGIDITKGRIPVYPCQHYLMGGIDVDINSSTGIKGLYAVGECSNTGVHGKNRLASNSLLEGMVFSRRAVNSMNLQSHAYAKIDSSVKNDSGKYVERGIKSEIRDMMQSSYFIDADLEKSKSSVKRLGEINEELKCEGYCRDREYYETLNMAQVSNLILGEIIENANSK